MRWYWEWLLARLSLSGNLCTLGLSPTIGPFIHESLKSVEAHTIKSIER